MKYVTISAAILCLGVVSMAAASAATPARCHAEVVRSEELPYAPPGSWLLKATVRITFPRGPTVESTFLKTVPWQVTLRRGDAFWLDCERLRDTWPASLETTR
ncbi:hypothetical protein [Bradyrhizobium genosp. P]|uniref:hypothetical protein n=1 Tax=Bradyrhizobium genosp. P TaxID=83641 RepID=UPI003CE6D07D